MRVHVLSGDMSKDLGFGEMVSEDGVVNVLRVTDKATGQNQIVSLPDGSVLHEDDLNQLRLHHPNLDIERDTITNNPVIKLDTGETVYGCQCWWERVKEDK